MHVFNPNRIRQFRDTANLTQEALAVLMSTHESRVYVQQISSWERGYNGHKINVANLSKLAHALNKTPNDFFDKE